ncbi:MAG: DUF2124 domain-containing protein [Methanomicrobiaceae archaeon]|nr:DUF2124 domain-containing protein [Methanomicrobiaceae archaeon]
MEKVESLRGVPGMLRPFKEYVASLNLKEKDQIVFYGCPGTCTPFVELLGYAIRDLKNEIVFVPFLDEKKAVTLVNTANIGLQASSAPEKLKPSLIVIMGGLAMPNVPVSAEDAMNVTKKYDSRIAGICFMSMFEKEKWTNIFDFEMIIDAEIDPVDIWKR